MDKIYKLPKVSYFLPQKTKGRDGKRHFPGMGQPEFSFQTVEFLLFFGIIHIKYRIDGKGCKLEKKEIKERLQDTVEQTIGYLEGQCSYEQLYEDGLLSMLYTRYQNARSVLQDQQAGYSRLRSALQFLISANRAYIGSGSDWEDPLWQILRDADKWIDLYLKDEAE